MIWEGIPGNTGGSEEGRQRGEGSPYGGHDQAGKHDVPVIPLPRRGSWAPYPAPPCLVLLRAASESTNSVLVLCTDQACSHNEKKAFRQRVTVFGRTWPLGRGECKGFGWNTKNLYSFLYLDLEGIVISEM